MPRPRHLAALLLPVLILWPRPRVLDAEEADFREDGGTGRVVGAITARLVAASQGGRLEVDVHAQGPRVDPVPGLEGIRGVNARTALEIDRVLRTTAPLVVTRDAQGREVRGTARPGPRATLPMRRLDGDGRLVLDARTAAAYPQWIRFDSGILPPGRHVLDVVVAGRSRLRAAFELGAGTGRITALRSRGEDEEVDR